MIITRLSNWRTPALLLVLLTMAGFCLANGKLPLLVVAWGVTITGWWFSERKGGNALPRWAVLSLVLAIILWAAFRASTPQQVDVTVFCEFLTMVLLAKSWDRKRARDIAQLIAMSIFLVIGAILDNNNIVVGVVVLLCMPLTVWAVMCLQIGAGQERAMLEAHLARAAACAALRRPFTNQEPPQARRFTVSTTKRLLPATIVATALGFVVAMAIFVVVPRGIAVGQFGAFGQPARGMRTGFTSEVELGRAGLLSESQRTVLEVSFSDGDNNPVGGEGQVYYLRGAVLDSYYKGRWNSELRFEDPRDTAQVEPTRDHTIIQEVDLRESTAGRNGLAPYFVLWRNTVLTSSEGAPDASGPGRLWYRKQGQTGPVHYRVISFIQDPPPEVSSRVPDVSFPSDVIREYAAQVLRRADFEPDPRVRPPSEDAAVARILTSHLRGNFEYTTEIGRPDDGADPIEWFLTKERKGHCEYFASALAALCRSVGINSRVIAGYVAAEYDEQTGKYTVRESNAHAWTEVEVAPGTWVTYDPTPPVALMNVHESRPTWHARLARIMDALNDTWVNSVVMFDNQSQNQLLDMRIRIPWIDSVSRHAADDFRESGGKSVVRYAIVTAAILATMVGLSVAALRAATDLGKVFGKSRRIKGQVDPQMRTLLQSAGFYADALKILDRAGLGKPYSVPPATHARRLAEINRRASEAFFEISILYYRVRFGRSQLSAQDLARADAQVEILRRSIELRAPETGRTSSPRRDQAS